MSEKESESEMEQADHEADSGISKDDLRDIVKSAVQTSNEGFIDSLEKLVDKRIENHVDKFDFKGKGNSKQFKLNSDVQRHIRLARQSLDNISATGQHRSSLKRAFDELEGATEILTRRNKHIKLADMSDAGWRVVDEYEAHELASNSEDEKKIFKAENRAKRKMKEAALKNKSKRRLNVPTNSTYTNSARVPDKQQTTSGGRRPGLCYQCGKPGHWRAECFSIQKPSNATFSRAQDDKISKSNVSTGMKCENESTVNSITVNVAKFVDDISFANECKSVGQIGCLARNSSILSPVGKLKCSLSKWKNTKASPFIVDLIEKGYKFPLQSIPSAVNLKNNASARNCPKFVMEVIDELLVKGCISETSTMPHVVNPLTVASNKSDKLRLVLDCRHINPCLRQVKFQYEDVSVATQMIKQGYVGFSFDLKSAYHHVPIFEEHRKLLGFSWNSKLYTFNVLPFGLSTAGYIFTKVLRHVVKVWRSKGINVVLYLDDGFVVSESVESAEEAVRIIRQDLSEFGFLVAENKSDWTPRFSITWLGHDFDLLNGMISITTKRVADIRVHIRKIIQVVQQSNGWVLVRSLASVVGKLQSSMNAVGYLVLRRTKYCHMIIESKWSWDSKVVLSEEARDELIFWLDNIEFLNGRSFVEHAVCDSTVFSDASAVGFGAFVSGERYQKYTGCWSASEAAKSSTWRELKTISKTLPRMAKALEGHVVKWNTDSKNVVGILRKGSMVHELHAICIEIHCMLGKYNIDLHPEWVSRSNNIMADKLSREAYKDTDDWQVSRVMYGFITTKWRGCTIDRFATSYNKKCERFNSKVWLAGTEAVDCMSEKWSNEVNWVVPPPKLILSVIKKIVSEKADSILVVPVWKSAAFWPALHFDNKQFISDTIYFQKRGNILPGFGKNGIFGDINIDFSMLACHFKF